MNHSFDGDPSQPSLELSESEIESLHSDLAQAVVLRGRVIDQGGVYPTSPEAPLPHIFQFDLDPEVVKDIFNPADDDLMPLHGSYIGYIQPHLVNEYGEDPSEIQQETVFISLRWRLAGSDIDQLESINLRNQLGLYDGYFNTEYEERGKRISPNNVPTPDVSSPEEVLGFIDDMYALERPLGIEDANKLRQLIEHVN